MDDTDVRSRKMAAGLESFEVNVKDFQGSSVVLKVQPEWNVGTVKQAIARRTSINPQDFRIVFAGQTLDDSARLWVGNTVGVHPSLI